jgi:hypothetical protein
MGIAAFFTEVFQGFQTVRKYPQFASGVNLIKYYFIQLATIAMHRDHTLAIPSVLSDLGLV